MRQSFSLLAALAAGFVVAASNDAACNCYLTNGTEPTYFSKRQFFDFRDLGEYAGVPDVIRDKDDTGGVTSDYFDSDSWTKHWSIQDWNNKDQDSGKLSGDAKYLMVNSPNNIYIERNKDEQAASDTFLTMRTARLAASQKSANTSFQTAAEFESTQEYHFASIRMLARVSGDPGAVLAVFTYLEADRLADIQEADIEILTRDPPRYIHYTNQPSYTDAGDDVPRATRNGSLPRGGGWDGWAVHRMDWTPERSVWYVDGAEVASIAFQTPRDPALVIFNAWSDGGSWSGKMAVGGAAFMQMQWIDIVYNTTAAANSTRASGKKGCSVVCSVDEAEGPNDTKVVNSGTPSRLIDSIARCGSVWIGAFAVWVMVQ